MDTDTKYIQNWFKSSDYDIVSAEVMLKNKRYIYVIFMCHLSIEKFLKGIVAKKANKIPPKTHDLYLLLKLSGIQLPATHQKIVAHLNEVSIPTRYPEDISKVSKQYNKKVAIGYLNETKSILEWLKKEIE